MTFDKITHMAGYTKLFNSILDSTIWQESSATRLLWITMLAMSDKGGTVQASIPGLARRAGIEIGECEAGLLCLSESDPYSRTPDHEGRRIRTIAGGWELLNHAKYRDLLSLEERREYNKKKQAEWRAKNAKNVNDMSLTVNHNKQCQHIADNRYQISSPKEKMKNEDSPSSLPLDFETSSICKPNSSPPPCFKDVEKWAKSQMVAISEDCLNGFWDEMETMQWTYKGGSLTPRTAWQARFRKWATNWHNNESGKQFKK